MKVIIDGKACDAKYGEYILDVARRNGIRIPALCHSDALPGQSTCRMCVVEVLEGGRAKTAASCVYPITADIEVVTNSEKILRIRKMLVRLLYARAPKGCHMEGLLEEYRIDAENRFRVEDKEKCMLCGLCVRACEELGAGAISTVNRGTAKAVSPPFGEPSDACIGCGSCASVCPSGAIGMQELDGSRVIWGKTFELLRCSRCGRYTVTPEQLEHIKRKCGHDDAETLCEACRKKKAADGLRDVFQHIKG